jgi:hypothetical protein
VLLVGPAAAAVVPWPVGVEKDDNNKLGLVTVTTGCIVNGSAKTIRWLSSEREYDYQSKMGQR